MLSEAEPVPQVAWAGLPRAHDPLGWSQLMCRPCGDSGSPLTCMPDLTHFPEASCSAWVARAQRRASELEYGLPLNGMARMGSVLPGCRGQRYYWHY